MSMKLFSQSTSGALQSHERITPVFVAQRIEAPLKKLRDNAEKAASFNPDNKKNQEAVVFLDKVIAEVEKVVRPSVNNDNHEVELDSAPSYRF